MTATRHRELAESLRYVARCLSFRLEVDCETARDVPPAVLAELRGRALADAGAVLLAAEAACIEAHRRFLAALRRHRAEARR